MDKLFVGLLVVAGLVMMPKPSRAGVAYLKKLEDFRAEPYKDAGGLWHIGYGHLLAPNEGFTSITQAQAEKLLMQDLKPINDVLAKRVNVPLSENQFDALVLFVYNIGIDNFLNSTMLKKLNNSDYVGASNEFKRWIYITVNDEKIASLGLRQRRDFEFQLFTS